MKKQLHILYVTGLGDEDPSRQRKVIRSWRWWGVEPELFRSDWSSDESWPQKRKRLLQRVDALLAEGKQVGLVGVSAGGSAVINAYAARKEQLVGAVLIAGKVNRPDGVGDKYRHAYPAMIESLEMAVESLASLDDADRRRILSRYALADELVHKVDSYIPGAHNRAVPIVGHITTIGTQITLGAPSLLHFLKKQM